MILQHNVFVCQWINEHGHNGKLSEIMFGSQAPSSPTPHGPMQSPG